ncbi:MAG: hypothetical protein PHE49_02790 [bacterium]|nr:hypothetical protein [bacterium]
MGRRKKIKFDARNVKVEDIGNIINVKKIGIKRISLFVIGVFVVGILYLIEYFSTVGLTFQLDRENRALKNIGEELDNLRAKEVNLARYDRIVNSNPIEADSLASLQTQKIEAKTAETPVVKETKNKVQKQKTEKAKTEHRKNENLPQKHEDTKLH